MNFSFQLLNNDKNSWCVFCYNCSRNLFNTLPSNPKISTMPPISPISLPPQTLFYCHAHRTMCSSSYKSSVAPKSMPRN